MIFMSERIANISEVESLLINAKAKFEILTSEIEQAASLSPTINDTACSLRNILDKANGFEFLIEKRKCDFIEFSERQKS